MKSFPLWSFIDDALPGNQQPINPVILVDRLMVKSPDTLVKFQQALITEMHRHWHPHMQNALYLALGETTPQPMMAPLLLGHLLSWGSKKFQSMCQNLNEMVAYLPLQGGWSELSLVYVAENAYLLRHGWEANVPNDVQFDNTKFPLNLFPTEESWKKELPALYDHYRSVQAYL